MSRGPKYISVISVQFSVSELFTVHPLPELNFMINLEAFAYKMGSAQLKNDIKQLLIILENSCVFLLLNDWVCLQENNLLSQKTQSYCFEQEF